MKFLWYWADLRTNRQSLVRIYLALLVAAALSGEGNQGISFACSPYLLQLVQGPGSRVQGPLQLVQGPASPALWPLQESLLIEHLALRP